MPHVRTLRSVQGYEWVAIHNPVLTIWAETGIPGIVLYLGVLGSAVWSFARHYRRHRVASIERLMPYFALVASLFLGYMPSWIKGGGMESNHTYFLMLALLLIPCSLETEGLKESERGGAQAAGRSSSGAGVLGSPPGVIG
jgi:O-antigen ligase